MTVIRTQFLTATVHIPHVVRCGIMCNDRSFADSSGPYATKILTEAHLFLEADVFPLSKLLCIYYVYKCISTYLHIEEAHSVHG